VGLNSSTFTDSLNAVIQALAHVTPLRNYFLVNTNSTAAATAANGINNDSSAAILAAQLSKSPLLSSFGELMRKIWNVKNFKNNVSPHDFLQAVDLASNHKFSMSKPMMDPMDFLLWFLNFVNKEIQQVTTSSGNNKQQQQTIITQTFQGKVRVTTEIEGKQKVITQKAKTMVSPFLFLTLELPAVTSHNQQASNAAKAANQMAAVTGAFMSDQETVSIPQVTLFQLLSKFDGETETIRTIYKTGEFEKKKYHIEELPQYLIFNVKRFVQNNYFLEKNPTIVNFPVKNLDMSEFVRGGSISSNNNSDLYKYDLVANIRHEGKPDETGTYKVHIHNKAIDKWYDAQNLELQPVMPQVVSISESYIQIYERKTLVAQQ